MKLMTRIIAAFLLAALSCYGQPKMTMWTSKPSYSYGETIEVRLRVWNDGDSSFTIFSPTTCVAWIALDNVMFTMGCGQMEVNLVFNPGDSRTWVWEIDAARYAYPTYSGWHTVYGVCNGIDSTTFDAPAYRGGPLSIKFSGGVSQSMVDSIRSTLDATLTWHHADTSGIWENWQVAGFPVDSLASAFSSVHQVEFATVPRQISPDSVLVTGIPVVSSPVADFRLYPNYPNPFNPTTIVRYELARGADVSLDILDLLGRKVASIVHDEQQSGEHTALVDGSRLASGIYICRLLVGTRVATMKILLLK